MAEYIGHDDAPSISAGEAWLRTKLGHETLERLLRPVRGPQHKSQEPRVMLLRAFQAGYVTAMRTKAAEVDQ